MPDHVKDPAFHLLRLSSQSNTESSCALTLLTEMIPKFCSLLLDRETLKSHFQLNLTRLTSGGLVLFNPPRLNSTIKKKRCLHIDKISDNKISDKHLSLHPSMTENGLYNMAQKPTVQVCINPET